MPERVRGEGAGGVFKFVLGFIAIAILCVLPLKASGAGASNLNLDHFEPTLDDKAALQRGAKTFVNYCLGCHEAGYSRYERVATDLSIPVDVALDNLIFDDAKIGQHMTNAMPEDAAKRWFGATPPDLTLVARSRGTDWLYTYLRSFYDDPSRPWGTNNTVFKDVGMPNVLLTLQGHQTCVPGYKMDHGKPVQDPVTGAFLEDENNPCGRVKHVEGTGTQSVEEFDQTIADLVSFMAYIAEPMALERQRLGVFVLMFIAVFFIFAWLLNREYWKDVDH